MCIFDVERLFEFPSKVAGRLNAARVDDLKGSRRGDWQTELAAEVLKVYQGARIMVGIDDGDGAAAAFGNCCDAVGIAAIRHWHQPVNARQRSWGLVAVAGKRRQSGFETYGVRHFVRNDETDIGVSGLARIFRPLDA